MRPTEVFLSHSARDRTFVTRLAGVLADHGVRTWYSQVDILGARQWHDEIGAALTRCDWFLLVLSPNSVGSRWVKRELLYALDVPRFDDRILPVVHRPCDFERLSWTLRILQMHDFTASFEEGCRGLLKTWGGGFHGEPPN